MTDDFTQGESLNETVIDARVATHDPLTPLAGQVGETKPRTELAGNTVDDGIIETSQLQPIVVPRDLPGWETLVFVTKTNDNFQSRRGGPCVLQETGDLE